MIFSSGVLSGQFNPRSNLSALLSNSNTLANYQMGVGLTGTSNASSWANQIGSAPALTQTTGAAQPAIQPDGSLLFNGTSHTMHSAFALAQPNELWIVFSQLNAVAGMAFTDGFGSTTQTFYNTTPAGSSQLYAGAALVGPAVILNTFRIVKIQWNGASSSITYDSGAPVTGNAGTQAAGGITVGSAGSGGPYFSNINVKEIIVLNALTSGAASAAIFAALKALYGTPL
jgi:hypothetical protein